MADFNMAWGARAVILKLELATATAGKCCCISLPRMDALRKWGINAVQLSGGR